MNMCVRASAVVISSFCTIIGYVGYVSLQSFDTLYNYRFIRVLLLMIERIITELIDASPRSGSTDAFNTASFSANFELTQIQSVGWL